MSCSPWKLAQVKTHTDCNKTGPKQNRQSRLTVTRSVWTDNTVDTHPTQLNQSNYTLYTGYRANTNYTHKHTLTTDSNTHTLYTLCTHQGTTRYVFILLQVKLIPQTRSTLLPPLGISAWTMSQSKFLSVSVSLSPGVSMWTSWSSSPCWRGSRLNRITGKQM